jgi:Zn finger protein HypA/HybF involved in hydrogenase expression
MLCCDFFSVISGLLVFFFLLAIEVCDRASSYIENERRLFWCRKCGEFYMNLQSLEFCECPRCHEKNSKLAF